MKHLLAVVSSLLATYCAPLTYSKQEVLDFERYCVAYVVVRSDSPHADTDYLVQELTEFSGFEAITTDTQPPATLVLEVALYIDWYESTDADGDTSTTWQAELRYSAYDAVSLQTLDQGTIEEEGSSATDASEDALDVLVLRYHRPFRL